MGIYLYRIRPGKVAEMSAIGVLLLFIAVFSGHYVPGSFLDPFFNLSKNSLVWNGVNFFGHTGNERAHAILVQFCSDVRGLVHSHHSRCRNTGGTVFTSGTWRISI